LERVERGICHRAERQMPGKPAGVGLPRECGRARRELQSINGALVHEEPEDRAEREPVGELRALEPGPQHP
jgi:hypothetical protein